MKIIFSMVIVYTGFGISFHLNRYLTQHLDLDGLGDVHVALSVAVIAAAFVIFGGQAAIHRFIPQYLADEQWGKVKGFIDHYQKLALKLGATAIAVSLSAAIAFKLFGLDKLLHETLLAIVITPIIALSIFIGAAIQSMNRPMAAIIPNEILKPAMFWLGCVVWLEFFSTFNEYEAIGILFVVSGIQLSVQVYLLRTSVPFRWRETLPSYDIASWHRVSKPLLYSALANALLDRIDVLALEILHTDEKGVGVFTLLIFIVSPIWMNFNAVTNVIAPRISTLDGDETKRQKLFNNAFASALLANFTVAALLGYYADDILSWFHDDMTAYKPWLLVMLAGTAVNCGLEMAAPFIRFGGHQDKAAKLALYILIANLLVTPTAIYFYGLEGAIVSILGMSFVRGMSYMVIMRQFIGIKPLRVI